jgi:hypothetical protein
MTSFTRILDAPLQRIGEWRDETSARREHDAIMRDPRMASEHAAAASRAGSHGCAYCH